jgi:hypothetical protein
MFRKFVAPGVVYENQIEWCERAIPLLCGGSSVLCYAETQSGKTGTEICLAFMMLDLAALEGKSILITVVQKIASLALKDQMNHRFFHDGDSEGAEIDVYARKLVRQKKILGAHIRVVHRGELPNLTTPTTKSGAPFDQHLIISDEDDSAQNKDGQFEKYLASLGVDQAKSPSEWDKRKTQVFLAGFTATPFASLADMMVKLPSSMCLLIMRFGEGFTGLPEIYEHTNRCRVLNGKPFVKVKPIANYWSYFEKELSNAQISAASNISEANYSQHSDRELLAAIQRAMSSAMNSGFASMAGNKLGLWKPTSQWVQEIFPYFFNECSSHGDGYLIVRLSDPYLEAARQWCCNHGLDHEVFTCDEDEQRTSDNVKPLKDFLNRLREIPERPTVLFISGHMRAGMTIPHDHKIRGVVETGGSSSYDALIQCWWGRATGYGRNIDVYPMWGHLAHVKEAVKFIQDMRKLKDGFAPSHVLKGRHNGAIAPSEKRTDWKCVELPSGDWKDGDSVEHVLMNHNIVSPANHVIGKKKVASAQGSRGGVADTVVNIYRIVLDWYTKGEVAARSTPDEGMLVYYLDTNEPQCQWQFADYEESKSLGLLGKHFLIVPTENAPVSPNVLKKTSIFRKP